MNEWKDNGLPVATIFYPDGSVARHQMGDQKMIDGLYSMIGYSVNQWAQIDRFFFELTHLTLGTSEVKTAIVYYRLRNQKERIELAKELIDATDLADLSEAWKRLYAEVKNLSPMRNAVAHQPLRLESTITNVSHIDPQNPTKIEHFMWVDIDEKELLRGEKRSKRIEFADLVKYSKQLHALTGQAKEFVELFRKRLGCAT